MKKYLILVLIAAALIVFSAHNKLFGDDITAPYSGKNASSIGAWYDEVWAATGFYQLTPSTTPQAYVYAHTTNPVTTTPPTFVVGDASVSQDAVVTEWSVTGHVHFKSQL